MPFKRFRTITARKSNIWEGRDIGFKTIDRNLGFAGLALASSIEKNRSLSTLKQLDKVIDRSKIQKILMAHYDVGFSNEALMPILR